MKKTVTEKKSKNPSRVDRQLSKIKAEKVKTLAAPEEPTKPQPAVTTHTKAQLVH